MDCGVLISNIFKLKPFAGFYVNIQRLWFSKSIKRGTGSFNDILLCSENIHLPCSFPLWRLSLGHPRDARRHARRPTQRHIQTRVHAPTRQTDAHTLDSFTVRDKWCLTLWPGEMGWLSSSEMKILLTKVPWAKQVVSLGNLDADFCSSRATCQSKHPPNNHFESWRTLSPRHKLVDWQLNGRMCSADIVSSEKRKKNLPLSFKNKSGIGHLFHVNRLITARSMIFMNIFLNI